MHKIETGVCLYRLQSLQGHVDLGPKLHAVMPIEAAAAAEHGGLCPQIDESGDS